MGMKANAKQKKKTQTKKMRKRNGGRSTARNLLSLSSFSHLVHFFSFFLLCALAADLIYDPTVCACGFDDANGREVRCAPPPPDLNQCLESVCNLETLQCQDWTHHAGCCQPTTIAGIN